MHKKRILIVLICALVLGFGIYRFKEVYQIEIIKKVSGIEEVDFYKPMDVEVIDLNDDYGGLVVVESDGNFYAFSDDDLMAYPTSKIQSYEDLSVGDELTITYQHRLPQLSRSYYSTSPFEYNGKTYHDIPQLSEVIVR